MTSRKSSISRAYFKFLTTQKLSLVYFSPISRCTHYSHNTTPHSALHGSTPDLNTKLSRWGSPSPLPVTGKNFYSFYFKMTMVSASSHFAPSISFANCWIVNKMRYCVFYYHLLQYTIFDHTRVLTLVMCHLINYSQNPEIDFFFTDFSPQSWMYPNVHPKIQK